MDETSTGGATVAQRIEAMEEAYEFMLAYAARGVVIEDAADEPGIRSFLQQMVDALDDLPATVAAEASPLSPALARACGAFVTVLAADAAAALPAVRLVLALPSISSQMIDNLNANIHLRALLADLFLIDETLKG